MPRKIDNPISNTEKQKINYYLDESSATSSTENEAPSNNQTFRSISTNDVSKFSTPRYQPSVSKTLSRSPLQSHKQLQRLASTPSRVTTETDNSMPANRRHSFRKSVNTSSSKNTPTAERLRHTSAHKQQNNPSSSAETQPAIIGSSRRRARKNKPKQVAKYLQETKRLQQSVHNLIPKRSFMRLIREILASEQSSRSQMHVDWRITREALMALQESAELYLIILFQDAYRCTIHRERVTLAVKDIELVKFLRRSFDNQL